MEPKTPKPKVDDGLTAKERHAKAAERPIVWNESRQAVVMALRQLKAYNEGSAVPADKISEVSGVDLKKVKIHCDVYRGTELSHPSRGIVMTARFEGDRQLYYYLSAEGKKVKF